MSDIARESPRDDGAPVGRRIVIGMVVASGAAVVGGQPALARVERLLHRFSRHPMRSSR